MSPALTYTLGRAIYVALTNRCNALTLPVTRGPSFAMPAASGFAPLPDGFEPTAEDLVAAVESRLASSDGGPSSVVFAGLGEPLLRLDVLVETAGRLHAAHAGAVALRVSTNGLVPRARSKEVARALLAAGVRRASVAIASSDEAQHRRLLVPRAAAVTPCLNAAAGTAVDVPGLEEACHFVTAMVAAGIEVECTAVAEPSVDLAAAEALAVSLGASFRSRSYHP